MATPKNPVQSVANLLLEARAEVNELLSAPDHNVILLGVNSDLDRTINRLRHLGGLTIPAQEVTDDFPPITEYHERAGAEFSRPLTLEDLDSDAAELEIFRAKVLRLYAQFETIEPVGILNDYTTPEAQLEIRGVAKLAGVEDYAERPLDVEFIEDIQKAIVEKHRAGENQARIDAELEKQDKIVKLQERIDEVTKKRADLSTDFVEAYKTYNEAKEGTKKHKDAEALCGQLDDEKRAADELLADLNKQMEELKA